MRLQYETGSISLLLHLRFWKMCLRPLV